MKLAIPGLLRLCELHKSKAVLTKRCFLFWTKTFRSNALFYLLFFQSLRNSTCLGLINIIIAGPETENAEDQSLKGRRLLFLKQLAAAVLHY